MYDYQAQVEIIHDGDTLRLLIDHGMHIRSSNSIRLKNVFAPELSSGDPGKKARDSVITWIAEHSHAPKTEWPFRVATEKDKQTFNRYVGVVTCATCNDELNAHLRALGYTDQGTGAH